MVGEIAVKSNHVGTVADGVLGLAWASIDASKKTELRSVRLALRSRRPDFLWWFDDSLREELERIANTISGNVHDQIQEAIACLRGEIEAEHLSQKYGWPNLRTSPDGALLDLEPYRGTAKMSDEEAARLLEHINSDEPLQIVIRGHLWLESKLIKYLADAVKNPQFLDNSRLSFSQRLNLAAALGLIPEEELPALFKLNRLRNKVAHVLEAAVTEAEQRELFNSLSQRSRRAALAGTDGTLDPFPAGLRCVICALIFNVENRHDQLMAEKGYGRYLEFRIHAALGKPTV